MQQPDRFLTNPTLSPATKEFLTKQKAKEQALRAHIIKAIRAKFVDLTKDPEIVMIGIDTITYDAVSGQPCMFFQTNARVQIGDPNQQIYYESGSENQFLTVSDSEIAALTALKKVIDEEFKKKKLSDLYV